MELSKEKLVNKIMSWKSANTKIRHLYDAEQYKVRSMRLRLIKTRDSIDYLLTYPYSICTSNRTGKKSAKHKR